jgi:hypothetical protein
MRLIDRAEVICQNQKDFNREVEVIKHDLTLNGYPHFFIDSVMKSRNNNNPSTDKVPHSTVVIPYVKGIQENSGALDIATTLEQFSKPNIHSGEH